MSGRTRHFGCCSPSRAWQSRRQHSVIEQHSRHCLSSGPRTKCSIHRTHALSPRLLLSQMDEDVLPRPLSILSHRLRLADRPEVLQTRVVSIPARRPTATQPTKPRSQAYVPARAGGLRRRQRAHSESEAHAHPTWRCALVRCNYGVAASGPDRGDGGVGTPRTPRAHGKPGTSAMLPNQPLEQESRRRMAERHVKCACRVARHSVRRSREMVRPALANARAPVHSEERPTDGARICSSGYGGRRACVPRYTRCLFHGTGRRSRAPPSHRELDGSIRSTRWGRDTLERAWRHVEPRRACVPRYTRCAFHGTGRHSPSQRAISVRRRPRALAS